MSHDVAVPEYSADHRLSIGENSRKTLLIALELRHRAPSCGAKQHRHPTRTIPFPVLERTTLPQGKGDFVRSGNPAVIGRLRSCFMLTLGRPGEIPPTCLLEVLECA
jgi:hypothetical protein